MLKEKMVTVEISGYSENEGTREFEILAREEIEKVIDNIDTKEIYKRTFKQADNVGMTGTAFTYIDAQTGEIKTSWIQQNWQEHPWADFKQIWLCTVKIPAFEFENSDILNDEEMEKFEKWQEERDIQGTLEKFVEEQLGKGEFEKRYEDWIDWLAQESEMDWENIKEQLDELYFAVIEK